MGIQILKLTRVQTNLKIQQRSSQAIKCKIAGQLFCKQLTEALIMQNLFSQGLQKMF